MTEKQMKRDGFKKVNEDVWIRVFSVTLAGPAYVIRYRVDGVWYAKFVSNGGSQ